MKKVLSIIMTVVAMLAIAATTVNAASVTADKTEVAKGEDVVVSFNTEDAQSVQFDLAYDSSAFELKSVTGDNTNVAVRTSQLDENTVRVIFIDLMRTETVNTISATFTAKADAEGTADFTVSNVSLDPADEVATPTATVTIAEPTTPDPVDDPVVDPEPATPADNTDNQQSADNSSDKPTKLPQTGTPVVAIVAGLAVVLVAAIAVRKIVK